MQIKLNFALNGKPNHNGRIHDRDDLTKQFEEKIKEQELLISTDYDEPETISHIAGRIASWTINEEGNVTFDVVPFPGRENCFRDGVECWTHGYGQIDDDGRISNYRLHGLVLEIPETSLIL